MLDADRLKIIKARLRSGRYQERYKDDIADLLADNDTLRTQLAAAQEERELIKQRAIATIKGRDADNRMLSDENARLRDRVKKLEIELSLPERTPRPYDSF